MNAARGGPVSYTPQTEIRMKYRRGEGNLATPLRAANLVLPGLNLCTVQGRRYKAVVKDLIAEYGSSDAERVRELAALRIALEQVQSEVVSGNASMREDMVRISNLASRKEKELRERVASASAVRDARPLHERIMSARPSGRAIAPKGSAFRDVADAPASRIRQALKQPVLQSDDEGDGDG